MTAFLLAPLAPAAPRKPGYTAAMKLRQNTVRIEAQVGEQSPEKGFGFIVGENDQGILYAVTAYHVVSNPDDVDGPPPKIEVELYDNRGEMIEAKLRTHDDLHDLAVITFRAPDGFEWDKKCLGSEEEQNELTEVWFVGRSGDWTVPPSPGTITSEQPEDGRIDIEDLSVRPGSSGGPLIASSGIVGMILVDSAEGAQALSISYIQSRLKKWAHPFRLRSSAPPRKPAEEIAEEDAPPRKPAKAKESAEEDAPPRKSESIQEDPVLAKGEAIALRDPYFAPLRELQREGPARRGFDRGMAVAENQTLWGPGKQRMLEELRGDEQEGFRIATWFAVDRNRNNELAAKGEAIAEADPLVAAARAKSSDPRYWLGFDIATAIFGNPRMGAQGNTATGTGSLGIRDSLMSPEAQRGFNASVAHHLSRKY